jgi:CPA2 family monovalent cation:H+ antiporter-2
MSLSLGRVAAAPFFVLTAALALVGVKLCVVALLGRMFGLGWPTGLRAGLLLGPGGEFSLVVTALAASGGLLAGEAADYALVLAALTMAAIPLLSQLGEWLLRPRGGGRTELAAAPPPPPPQEGPPRVIIAGFGRVGQTVADMLEVHRIAYIALDSDPDLVARARARGRPVYYGDMTQPALLHHLDLDAARGVVVTITGRDAADALVAAVRGQRAHLLVVARARDAEHAARLYAAGATDAVPETIEASLQLAEAVLVDIGIPMGPVIASIHEKRSEFQRAMRAGAPAGREVRALGRRRLRDALVVAAPEEADRG